METSFCRHRYQLDYFSSPWRELPLLRWSKIVFLFTACGTKLSWKFTVLRLCPIEPFVVSTLMVKCWYISNSLHQCIVTTESSWPGQIGHVTVSQVRWFGFVSSFSNPKIDINFPCGTNYLILKLTASPLAPLVGTSCLCSSPNIWSFLPPGAGTKTLSGGRTWQNKRNRCRLRKRQTPEAEVINSFVNWGLEKPRGQSCGSWPGRTKESEVACSRPPHRESHSPFSSLSVFIWLYCSLISTASSFISLCLPLSSSLFLLFFVQPLSLSLTILSAEFPNYWSADQCQVNVNYNNCKKRGFFSYNFILTTKKKAQFYLSVLQVSTSGSCFSFPSLKKTKRHSDFCLFKYQFSAENVEQT